MKIKTLALSAAAMFALTGCATIFTGTTQPVKVKTVSNQNYEAIDTVNCHMEDEKGRVYSMNSLGSATVTKNAGSLTIVCKKPGYKPTEKIVSSSFQPVALLDLFFWPTGFVDLATGAYMKYPEEVTVNMEPQGRRA